MPKKILSIVFLVFVCGLVLSFAQEDSVTFTTYYPSPYGSYNQLQTNSLGVGDNNGDGILSSADVPPTPGPPNGDVWISGKVGIGTANPGAKLHVNSTLRVGTGASNTGLVDFGLADTYLGYDSGIWKARIYDGADYFNAIQLSGTGHGVYLAPTEGNVGIGTASPGAKLEVNSVMRLTPVSSAPTGVEGGLYYNTTENVVKYHDGSAWKNIGGEVYSECTGVCATNNDAQCASGYTRVRLLSAGTGCAAENAGIKPGWGGNWYVLIEDISGGQKESLYLDGLTRTYIACRTILGNQASSCAVCCK